MFMGDLILDFRLWLRIIFFYDFRFYIERVLVVRGKFFLCWIVEVKGIGGIYYVF